jgi:hypothetical protein
VSDKLQRFLFDYGAELSAKPFAQVVILAPLLRPITTRAPNDQVVMT